MQYCYPSDVKGPLEMVQQALDLAVIASWGSDEAFKNEIIEKRIRLPIKEGGAGYRKLVDVLPAAFIGASWQIFPRLIDRKDGTKVIPGYHQGLERLFGSTSFDPERQGKDRMATLCQGVSRLGMEYSGAYLSMREKLSVTEREHGPLQAPLHDGGWGYQMGGGQSALTK